MYENRVQAREDSEIWELVSDLKSGRHCSSIAASGRAGQGAPCLERAMTAWTHGRARRCSWRRRASLLATKLLTSDPKLSGLTKFA